MLVRIILDASGAHPLFTAVVTSPANEEFRTCYRFAAFRDLSKGITAIAPNVIKSPFPPTHKSSSLGLKLSQAHLEWCQDVITSYDRFHKHPELQQEIAVFFGCMKYYLARKENSSESTAAKRNSLNGNSDKKDMKKQVTMPPSSLPSMSVLVSRGAVLNSHPTYEVIIKYDPSKRPHIVSKFFKDYRSLCLALENIGVSSDTSAAHVLPEFPVSYSKSKVGIALTEAEMQQRCSGLDVWTRGVLYIYHELQEEARTLINDFLKLNIDDVTVPYASLIITRLREGRISASAKQTSMKGTTGADELAPESLAVTIKPSITSEPSSDLRGVEETWEVIEPTSAPARCLPAGACVVS